MTTPKTILITGCRSGFGLLFAQHLAKRGHRVYAGLRDVATADGLHAATAEHPVTAVQLDVTDASQRDAVVAQVLAEAGRIDVLVNNAGIALGGPLETVSEDELRQLFEVNVFGPWALTQACLPTMREQGAGRVIQISSMAGRQALPCLAAYAGSKFALEGLSEGWRHELYDLGIDMVLVEPGPYATDIFERNRRLSQAHDSIAAYMPLATKLDGMFQRIAKGGAGDPNDVARLVVKLVEMGGRPKLRYALGPKARSRLLASRFLPGHLYEGLVRTMIRRG